MSVLGGSTLFRRNRVRLGLLESQHVILVSIGAGKPLLASGAPLGESYVAYTRVRATWRYRVSVVTVLSHSAAEHVVRSAHVRPQAEDRGRAVVYRSFQSKGVLQARIWCRYRRCPRDGCGASKMAAKARPTTSCLMAARRSMHA